MKNFDVDTGRVLAAAIPAGSAYLAAVWLDNKVSAHKFNDLKLVGQIVTTKSPAWVVMGLINHYGFSVIVTLLYASWACRRLPGPGWLKGVIFLQIESAVLYPGALFLEPRHAGMRSGQVPTLFSWKSFWGQAVRHVAFGAVLGAIYKCSPFTKVV